MSQQGSQPKDLEDSGRALNSEVKSVNIRLREGQYQLSFAKAIASYQLKLCFPDVKESVRKLFGEKKTECLQFVSKAQTILKKIERSGIIRTLHKGKLGNFKDIPCHPSSFKMSKRI